MTTTLDAPAEAEVDWTQAVTIGPSWQRNPDGSWALPEHTLGWQALDWTAENLQNPDGTPWQYTDEQARFLLWYYAVDNRGRFLFRDAILQRLKGWGKDPFAATIVGIEFVGPCRFSHWSRKGEPVAKEHPAAWIQLIATEAFQNRNLSSLLPGLFTKRCIADHGIVLGFDITRAHGSTRRIEVVTSSPSALEGGRPTLCVCNETHLWVEGNKGLRLTEVIDRNLAKSKDGSSRRLAITNAFDPGVDSVGRRDREAYELMAAGGSMTSGILYDSVEGHPAAPLTPEAAPLVLASVRGDSHWLDIERLMGSVLDTRYPPSTSRRFYYNQIVANDEAWVDPQKFDLLGDKQRGVTTVIEPADEIALFFDGSKSDDSTGLTACRISDGHVEVLGLWAKPPGERGKLWTVDRPAVDLRVREVLTSYKVVAFWGDPSHAKDDVTQVSYWDGLLDTWHRDFGHKLNPWAVGSAKSTNAKRHSITWDMTDSRHQEQFTLAAMMCANDIDAGNLTWGGNDNLRLHVHNARLAPNAYGVSIRKEGRESARKIDLAVTMIGARMLRREILNLRGTTEVHSFRFYR